MTYGHSAMIERVRSARAGKNRGLTSADVEGTPVRDMSAAAFTVGRMARPGVRSGAAACRPDDRCIREICSLLAREYGTPRHGNKTRPLDELIYIILSTRTRDAAYRRVYNELKAAYPSWNSISVADTRRIELILRPIGLSSLKAHQIVDIVDRLRSRFGRATLAPLKGMSDADAEAFLTTLPGVAAKVAKCVLMYSLDREVLPVDVHVHRIATRIGLDTKKRPDSSQDLIEKAFPIDLRYGFHVNAIAHGRSVCVARSPRCNECVIASMCGASTRAPS